MKRGVAALVTTALILVLAARAAEARLPWARDIPGRERGVERIPRCDVLPPMEFVAGTLGRDSRDGWALDGFPLQLARDHHVEVDGSPLPGTLESGRRALVMGYRRGNVLVACRLRILQPEVGGMVTDLADLTLSSSESDPTVGLLIDGPR